MVGSPKAREDRADEFRGGFEACWTPLSFGDWEAMWEPRRESPEWVQTCKMPGEVGALGLPFFEAS